MRDYPPPGGSPRAEPGYGGACSAALRGDEGPVFYTDGDAQYDPTEMAALGRAGDGVDWVNGYKISRSDPLHRIVIGRIYHHTVKLLFGLAVRDVDCDFRMIRRSVFETVRLEKTSGVICLEMMKKFHDFGFRVAEVPVHHYHRAYGKSQFFNFPRLVRTAIDVARLWVALVVQRRHMHEVVVPDSLGYVHARSSRSTGRDAHQGRCC